MNVQIPIPSFDDIRKLLNFWIDQQDKWFYFEIETTQAGSIGDDEEPHLIVSHNRKSITNIAKRREFIKYIQNRLVGCVYDVISYPPSLLLKDTKIFTVSFGYRNDGQVITNIRLK